MHLRNIIQDVRYALRQLRKSPGFTLTAVTVLALGLGANSAVFTLLDGILLRPLPYAQPDRIVAMNTPMSDDGRFMMLLSYANMRQLSDAAGTQVQTAALLDQSTASVVGPGGRFQVEELEITAGMMPMLGVEPLLGRGFRQEENDPGRNRVLLLSENAWRKLYNADPHVAGKTLSIKGEVYTIVGVMPRGFAFPFRSQCYFRPSPFL